ncbi:MAG: tetratricopeptide repeat protein [Candidatus Eisenbacteria bacterium]
MLFAAVAGIVTAVHWPVLDAQADCFDDFQYIDENPLVMHPGWDSAQRFLTEVAKPSTVTGYYQPLTMISLMSDVALGASPAHKRPFHATSLILHVANTLLLALILYRLFGNPWAAAAAGLLFGLHPMTVEPIAWSSECKTLLSSFFALLSVYFYVRHGHGGRRRIAWVASLGAYALALLAKPTATTLPGALLLLAAWPLGTLWRRPPSGSPGGFGVRGLRAAQVRLSVLWELVPFLAVGTVSAIVTFISQRDAGGVATPGGGYPVWRIPLVLCYDVFLYTRNIVRPTLLAPHNPFPDPVVLTNPGIAAGLGLALLFAGALLLSLRRTAAILIGVATFVVLILPTLQLVQFSYSVISDKYAYLPAIGLLLILAWALVVGFARLRPRRSLAFVFAMLAVPVLALAVGESIATRRQLGYWRSTETLDRRLIALTPDNSEFHFDLGNALWDQGRLEDAHRELQTAVDLDSTNVRALNNLALSAAFRDEEVRAIALWRQTLRHHPQNYVARCNLAYYSLERTGQIRAALAEYERALQDYLHEKEQGRRARAVGRADPGAPSQVQAMLGHAYLLIGDPDSALTHLQESLRLPLPFPLATGWLAEALVARAQADSALLQAYHRAAGSAGPARAFAELGRALQAGGHAAEASVARTVAEGLAGRSSAPTGAPGGQ